MRIKVDKYITLPESDLEFWKMKGLLSYLGKIPTTRDVSQAAIQVPTPAMEGALEGPTIPFSSL
jgi:hypothetical protein